MKVRQEYTCPFELTHDITKGKWKPVILWSLRHGNVPPSVLEREIVGINQKMLLEHLRELQEFGLISRKKEPGYPLRVEYSLTPRGRRMLDALDVMQQVGMEIIGEHTKKSVMDNPPVLP